jgi:hypothetical protein
LREKHEGAWGTLGELWEAWGSVRENMGEHERKTWRSMREKHGGAWGTLGELWEACESVE